MNREYTPTNTLQNYVSNMTLDKNNGVYLSDTETPSSSIFSRISIVVIIGICVVFVLAYYNINLFIITGNIIQQISDTLTPIFLNILQYFGIALGSTAVVTTKIASAGISDITSSIDTTNKAVAGAIVSGIQGDGLNEIVQPISLPHHRDENSFNIVNTAPQIVAQQREDENKQYLNNIQYNRPVGYCFIGQQNNRRYCSDITESNQCASGDIFPTMDICINPNIRIS